ncbi:MAG: o-succinylbenzoate synthase [Holophagales bacterium]|nr:o-succinylbenzoate synthase [Holophagales bacterium]
MRRRPRPVLRRRDDDVGPAHRDRAFLLPLVEAGLTLGEVDSRFQHVRGNRMAKATVENALVDLVAKAGGVPLHEVLGGPRKRISSGISLGLQETPADLVKEVEAAVAKGYHRVKVKVKRGKDVDYVAAVRNRFPDIPLMADANGDYRPEDAAHLARLDAFGLTMIEQPLSTAISTEHAALQKRLATPLCLDESIHDLADAKAAIALGSCRILSLKQGRVGGLLESLRILRHAASCGVPVWSGGMDETGISRAVNIHLQTLDGFTLPGDVGDEPVLHEDLVEPAVVLDDERLHRGAARNGDPSRGRSLTGCEVHAQKRAAALTGSGPASCVARLAPGGPPGPAARLRAGPQRHLPDWLKSAG